MLLLRWLSIVTKSAAIQRGICAEMRFCFLWDPCFIHTSSYSLLKDCTYLHAYVGMGKYSSTEAEDYAEKPGGKEWRLY